jgi:hypothetical protein
MIRVGTQTAQRDTRKRRRRRRRRRRSKVVAR